CQHRPQPGPSGERPPPPADSHRSRSDALDGRTAMRLPELHPDELLSRESSSTLTATERADLSAHLARCPACALERTVRREAARVRVPSDLDHAIAARVVGRLLADPDREIGPVKRGGFWGR